MDVHEGHLVVAEEAVIDSRVTGGIRVVRDGALSLRGVCEGGVTVEEGAEAHITGTTYGLWVHAGADVDLAGVAYGPVVVERGGSLAVSGRVRGPHRFASGAVELFGGTIESS